MFEWVKKLFKPERRVRSRQVSSLQRLCVQVLGLVAFADRKLKASVHSKSKEAKN